MFDDRKTMKVGVVIAAILIVVRIALEQAGAPESINSVFGVAWLYFLIPVFFALGIRAREYAGPYKVLLSDVVLFAVYTRLMVMVTYILAYFLKWDAPRFTGPMGGNVGDNISLLKGVVLIPLENALSWIVVATILGMIIGSVTLLLSRRSPRPAAAA